MHSDVKKVEKPHMQVFRHPGECWRQLRVHMSISGQNQHQNGIENDSMHRGAIDSWDLYAPDDSVRTRAQRTRPPARE